ncbi:hypothetical protein [Sphingomonas bacterium]|uniref:hypothetical protein n=1 Tax=Sphingomonas bacterium TaxID=1895847 RepID=UPI00157599D8|nr:hypothetical protein [Sphingomonas bacterium]
MTTSADQGSIADVGSPVLIAADPVDDDAAWRWTSVTIAVATVLLVLLNADAVSGWFDDLTPNTVVEQAHAPVAGWADATRRGGLDAPRATLHAAWQKVRAARFGSEQPGERGAAD